MSCKDNTSLRLAKPGDICGDGASEKYRPQDARSTSTDRIYVTINCDFFNENISISSGSRYIDVFCRPVATLGTDDETGQNTYGGICYILHPFNNNTGSCDLTRAFKFPNPLGKGLQTGNYDITFGITTSPFELLPSNLSYNSYDTTQKDKIGPFLVVISRPGNKVPANSIYNPYHKLYLSQICGPQHQYRFGQKPVAFTIAINYFDTKTVPQVDSTGFCGGIPTDTSRDTTRNVVADATTCSNIPALGDPSGPHYPVGAIVSGSSGSQGKTTFIIISSVLGGVLIVLIGVFFYMRRKKKSTA